METSSSRRGSGRELVVRTSSTDSVHSDRPKLGKSSKSGDGQIRSPRAANQSQKKLGTRIADLESQLGLAQEELKCLKDHLSTTDTGRKTTAVENKAKKQQHKVPEACEIEEKRATPINTDTNTKLSKGDDVEEGETDVFQVCIEKVVAVAIENEDNFEAKVVDIVVLEPKDGLRQELALKEAEINLLKAKLSEKDKEMEGVRRENESLKKQVDEKWVKISEREELSSKLSKVEEELEENRSSIGRMSERLEAAEKAKEELENEMMKLRVQTEQWRKAADAAALVLAGGDRIRISERCGSMDTTNVGGMNEDCEKRKGIRMLGELWKKKGQK